MFTGNGTKEDPYVIRNSRELSQIFEHLSSYFVLENDITLDGEFRPIGGQFEPFTGVFDGQNHCIFSLLIETETQYVGLFAYNVGTIKNLHIENAKLLGVSCVGAVAGVNEGTIENCSVSAEISATCNCGIVVGLNMGQIQSCKASGNVFETAAYFGDEKSDLEIFVSLGGSEKADGTKENPFGSIEKAKNAVRGFIKKGFSGNITVFLREGTYYIEKEIEFNEADCFPHTHHVVYSAYNNENVHIIGGKVLSDWEKAEKGLQKAYVGENVNCKYLCVDGRLKMPAKGSAGLFSRFSGSNVYAYYSHGWFSEILKVRKTLFGFKTLIPKSKFSGKANYLLGAVNFIKKDGDWALSDNGYVYFKNPENHEIIVPTVKNIFFLKNVRGITIRNLHFSVTDRDENFTAQGGRGKEGYDGPENIHGAVCLVDCSECTIANNKIDNCALNGISVKGSSTRNSIFGNRIENMGFAGIHCSGNWIDTPVYNNKHHYIKSNEISKVGMFAVNGAGIYLLGSGHNCICNNLIYDTPRYGISLKGARYHCWPTDCGINKDGRISFDEHFDYLHTRNNLIQANEIFDAGKNSLDGGGIEAWGPGRGNVADYNLVYNYYNGKPTVNWKGHGIFLDDATHYFTVTNNIVYESGKQGSDASTFMKSIGIVVRNNIFDVTNTHQGAANISPYDEPCSDQIFMNNIVYADPKGGIGEDGAFIENGSCDRRVYTYDTTAAKNQNGNYIKYLDRNIYYNTKGKLTVSKNNNDPSKDIDLKKFIEETGFDSESIISDPMFKDPANRNYELLPDSPAFKLGFKNIDMSKIGIQNSERG